MEVEIFDDFFSEDFQGEKSSFVKSKGFIVLAVVVGGVALYTWWRNSQTTGAVDYVSAIPYYDGGTAPSGGGSGGNFATVESIMQEVNNALADQNADLAGSLADQNAFLQDSLNDLREEMQEAHSKEQESNSQNTVNYAKYQISNPYPDYTPLDTSGNDYAAMSGMSEAHYAALKAAGQSYNDAKARGDTAAMDAAHQQAESIRNLYNYSGGVDGSQYIAGSAKSSTGSTKTSSTSSAKTSTRTTTATQTGKTITAKVYTTGVSNEREEQPH